ncbi:hypothetical protein D9M69_450500 [compost metagenome]
MNDNFFLSCTGTWLENDYCMNGLAPFLAGNGNDRALRYVRMAGNGCLDLGGVHVLAAGDDHVLDAVADVDEAVLVHVTAVTGVHPPAAQHLGSGLRFIPVAEHHVRPAHNNLARSATRDLAVIPVDNTDFDAYCWQACRVHLSVCLILGTVMFRQK